MTIASGAQARTMTLPAIADCKVPDATTTVPSRSPPLTGSHFVDHVRLRPSRVRRQLLLGRPARPAARDRRNRHPGREVGTDARPAARHLRREPALHRRQADRRAGRRAHAACSQRQRGAGGPLRARRRRHLPERWHPRRRDCDGAQHDVRLGAADVHRLEHRPACARLRRGRRIRFGRTRDRGRHPRAAGDTARTRPDGHRRPPAMSPRKRHT